MNAPSKVDGCRTATFLAGLVVASGVSPLSRWLVPVLVVAVALAGCQNLPGTGADERVGAKYEDYLTGGGVLIVEIDHAPNNAPSADAKQGFREELERITEKRVELRVNQQLPSKGQSYVYSVSELRELTEQFQDEEDRTDVVVMHALFVDGRVENNRVAGLAFQSDAFAIAMGTMKENTCPDGSICLSGRPSLSCALEAVMIHEAGHLLGLVGITLPMVNDHEMKQDPNPDTPQNEGEGHSDNEDSVMWWQVELGPQLVNLFDRGCQDIPNQFDAEDMRDAKSLRRG